MLTVEHIHKAYGSKSAVRDVNFSIRDGATFGLLGPNGAGKTTTMRMILGIVNPDSGEIAWNGRRVDESVRRRFGYLPEERGLYGRVKVKAQIKYFAALHGLTKSDANERTNRWIERLDLTEYAATPCSELSKGNQQKVQVACAVVHDPEFVILDEPFSGLDPANAQILCDALSDLKALGTTLILSSHQLWQLESLCDSFCIIARGRNQASGTMGVLSAGLPARVVRVKPAAPEIRQVLLAVPGARERQSGDHSIEVEVPADTDYAALLRSLVQTAKIVRFEVVEPSLQEIYMRAIASEAR